MRKIPGPCVRGFFSEGAILKGSRRRREAAVVGGRRDKGRERSFRRKAETERTGFWPDDWPPMAQEKAIAEAKAMNEQFVDTSSVSFAYS